MGAASYIGRIGGLAVALGVGTAIITGQGVAYATPDAGSQDGGSQSSAHRRRPNQDQHRHAQPTTPATPRTRIPGPPKPTDAIEPPQRRLVPSEQQRLFDDCQMLPTRPRSGWPTRFMTRPHATNGVKATSPGTYAVRWIVITDRAGHQAHIGSWYRRHRQRLRYRQRRGRTSSSTKRRLLSNGWRLRAPRRERAGDYSVDRFHPDVAVDTAALPHRAGPAAHDDATPATTARPPSIRPTSWPPCSATCSTRSPEIRRTHRRRTRRCPGCSWEQRVARSASTRSLPNRFSLLRIRSRMRR